MHSIPAEEFPFSWIAPKGTIGFAELQLLEAISSKNIGEVKLWLKRGAKVEQCRFQYSALWMASALDLIDLFRILCTQNAAKTILTDIGDFSPHTDMRYQRCPLQQIISNKALVLAFIADPALPEQIYGRNRVPNPMEQFAAAWPRRRLLWISWLKNRTGATSCLVARLPKELIRIIDQFLLRVSVTGKIPAELMKNYKNSTPKHLVPIDAFHRWDFSMLKRTMDLPNNRGFTGGLFVHQ